MDINEAHEEWEMSAIQSQEQETITLESINAKLDRVLVMVDALTPHLPKLEALPSFGLPWKRKKSDD